MEQFGVTLSNIGFIILPLSFISYFGLGVLLFLWNKRYISKPIKALWYILNALLMLSKDINIETVAIMILFFEAFDSIIDYCEEKKERKTRLTTQC